MWIKALLLGAALTLQAETICGKKYSTPEFHEIHIQCLPDIKQTRVVGRPKFGRAFEMSLPGQDWLVGTWKDEHGVTWTGVYFHGTEHEELPRITVLVPVGAL